MPGEPQEDLRNKLALVLDVDDLVAASRMAKELKPWFGVAKVGLELFSATGSDAISSMHALGYEVFADLKLHDIPTTVNRSAKVFGSLGVKYLTLHAFGGVDMLRAGNEGLAEGAARAGSPTPTALAVTILTSDHGAPPHILPKRVQIAREGGCGGIVCAVGDAREARTYAPRLTIACPGIRMAGDDAHDQARPATPAEAVEAGVDLLVVGRAVSAAADPAAAAQAIHDELAGAPQPV